MEIPTYPSNRSGIKNGDMPSLLQTSADMEEIVSQ